MKEYILEATLQSGEIEYVLSIDGTLQNVGTPVLVPRWETKENGDPIIGGATYRVYYRYLNGDWSESQYEDKIIPPDPADTDIVGARLGLTDVPVEDAPSTIAAFVPATIDGVTTLQLVQISFADLNIQLGNIGSGNTSTGHYTHTQSTPASSWVVNHSLGFRPAGIVVRDSAGNHWIPDTVVYDTVNQLTLTFGSISFGGVAYIS